jgi:hypothetical protein
MQFSTFLLMSLVKIMLCIQLHCQKGLNCKSFHIKSGHHVVECLLEKIRDNHLNEKLVVHRVEAVNYGRCCRVPLADDQIFTRKDPR